MVPYRRPAVEPLRARLAEPRRFLQVIAGPRQIGKTTAVRQLLPDLGLHVFASADEPSPAGPDWIASQWERARILAGESASEVILALDEIQKIPGWSETVKRLWDEDSASGVPVKVVVLGSAPLLIQTGLTESLAGRFEVLRLSHWSLAEMRDAFDFDLERYLFFGGYPGAASLVADTERWRRYVLDSLVETTVSRDVLLMTRVDKPVLLRRLFDLACRCSAQILSYNKMLGQLQDAGNTTTLAHYLDLLSGAGMVTGLQKYTGHVARSRASSPKLQVLDPALLSATSRRSPEEFRLDPTLRGQQVESAVGAHLVGASQRGELDVTYWRHRDREVDFVLERGGRRTTLEVKSGRTRDAGAGHAAFRDAFGEARPLVVGTGGIPLEEFLTSPVSRWL